MVQAKEGGVRMVRLGVAGCLWKGLFVCGKELAGTEGVLFWALGWLGITFYNALAVAAIYM